MSKYLLRILLISGLASANDCTIYVAITYQLVPRSSIESLRIQLPKAFRLIREDAFKL